MFQKSDTQVHKGLGASSTKTICNDEFIGW